MPKRRLSLSVPALRSTGAQKDSDRNKSSEWPSFAEPSFVMSVWKIGGGAWSTDRTDFATVAEDGRGSCFGGRPSLTGIQRAAGVSLRRRLRAERTGHEPVPIKSAS
jgi:hypothetical protein